MTTVIFAGKAYLKIDSLVKTLLHEFMAVARSGLWAPGILYFFLSGQIQGDNDLFLSIYSYLLVYLQRFYRTPFASIYRKFEHYNDPSFVSMFKYMVPLLI